LKHCGPPARSLDLRCCRAEATLAITPERADDAYAPARQMDGHIAAKPAASACYDGYFGVHRDLSKSNQKGNGASGIGATQAQSPIGLVLLGQDRVNIDRFPSGSRNGIVRLPQGAV
jgi:hypothetical protein